MSKPENLQENINEVLQEIRIVLPGTQALLGFQFVAFFNPVFQALSSELHYLHFGSLILTMICTMLLIAPVAFQQIAEDGKSTQRFLNFARKMLKSATTLLLLAFSGDVFLAAQVIDLNDWASGAIAGVVFLVGIYLWYFYAYLHRNI